MIKLLRPETVEKIDILEWSSNNEDLSEEILNKTIKKFKNHPIIVKIKHQYLMQEKISFHPVSVKDVENVIKNIPSNKAAGGDIPIQILKRRGVTYQILTDCINDTIKFCVKFLFIHQLIAFQKLEDVFISSKKLFSFSRYSIFCKFFLSLLHFQCHELARIYLQM